eukprot:gb/GECG01009971.1/.p1 GENE.gb/GECG01009971.1/~~gb/GECG01009971.1/.p1  ORF type:complete len:330 (+),score=15.59 gb/GECG01009971.1/:1-990(+)
MTTATGQLGTSTDKRGHHGTSAASKEEIKHADSKRDNEDIASKKGASKPPSDPKGAKRKHSGRRIMLQALAFVILAVGTAAAWAMPNFLIAPLLPSYVLILVLYCKFIPPGIRHIVGYLRLVSWLTCVQIWGTLICAPLAHALTGSWRPAVWSWYLVLFLFVFKPVVANRISKDLTYIFYDIPGLFVVWTYHLFGWRINSLYTPITDEILLGAAPFPEDVSRLKREKVKYVINLCREYKGPVKAYKRHGIEQLHLPVSDGDCPSLEYIDKAVTLIEKRATSEEKVFVHCKCGMGRSATVVYCHLIRRGWKPEEALKSIRSVRFQYRSLY